MKDRRIRREVLYKAQLKEDTREMNNAIFKTQAVEVKIPEKTVRLTEFKNYISIKEIYNFFKTLIKKNVQKNLLQ